MVASGGVQCAGFNNEGQLGDGTTNSSTQLESVSGLGGLWIVDVAAGYEFSCALTDADEVYCWGDNANGQLGYFGSDSLTRVLVGLGDLDLD